jgi:hypothetical protein
METLLRGLGRDLPLVNARDHGAVATSACPAQGAGS